MKKKLLDRRGAAIELAIMMMVFSIFITTIILTTALLQNEHKTKAQLGIEQDIFLEQLGEKFIAEVLKDHTGDSDWYKEWSVSYEGVSVEQGTVVWHKWVKGETVNPTCKAEGYTVEVCTLCNETRKTEIKDMLPHTLTNSREVESEGAPCQTTKKEVGYCSDCEGERENILEPEEHDWKDQKVEQPTCTEEGYREQYCSACGTMRKVDFTPVKEHTIVGEPNITKPTCTDDGIKTYTCRDCGECSEVVEKATGHAWGDITADEEQVARCEGTQACTKCDATETVAYHTWEKDEDASIDETCTKAGKMKQVCTACMTEQITEVPATGHAFENKKCTACGITGGYTLTVITAGEKSYLLSIEEIEPENADKEENTPSENLELCPAGGSVVLKITISLFEDTYKITEWSKK